MLNSVGLWLAGAAVALGAGVGFADPFDHSPRGDVGATSANQNYEHFADNERNQVTYRNGYATGYDAGAARHRYNDASGPDQYRKIGTNGTKHPRASFSK